MYGFKDHLKPMPLTRLSALLQGSSRYTGRDMGLVSIEQMFYSANCPKLVLDERARACESMGESLRGNSEWLIFFARRTVERALLVARTPAPHDLAQRGELAQVIAVVVADDGDPSIGGVAGCPPENR